jgi:hypothetical protein
VTRRFLLVLFYLFVMIFSVFTFYDKENFQRDTLLLFYLIYIIVGLSNILINTKLSSWDKIIGWSFFLYSISIPLYILSNGKVEQWFNMSIPYLEIYDVKLNTQFILLCIIFLSCFYMGFAILNGNKAIKTPEGNFQKRYNYKYSKIFVAFWIFLCFGIFLIGILKINYISALSSSYSLKNTGYIYLFSGVFGLDIGLLILMGLSNFKRKYVIFSLLIHLIILPLGIRQITMTFIFQVMLLYIFVKKINIKMYIKKYLAPLILIFWSFGIIGNLRSKDTFELTLIDVLIGPIKFYMFETTFNAISILKMLNIMNYINIEYTYGKSFIDPFVALVPSFIMPNKNEYNSFENFIIKYSHYENLKPVGTAHLLTELLANGGVLFIIAFAFLLGLVSFVLQIKTETYLKSNNILGLIFISSIIPYFLIQLNRGGLDILIKLILQFSILPILIVFLFRKRSLLQKHKI